MQQLICCCFYGDYHFTATNQPCFAIYDMLICYSTRQQLKLVTLYIYIYIYILVHGFSRLSYDVEEGEILETIFEPNVKGETKFPTLLISGNITAEPSGTARA